MHKKVIALPKVYKFLESLVSILYENEYFGLRESAHKYVDDLFDDIITNLPLKLHKPAPKQFDKYGKGMNYAVFRKSKRTSWYVFFKTYRKNDEIVHLVRYVANNHVIAQYL